MIPIRRDDGDEDYSLAWAVPLVSDVLSHEYGSLFESKTADFTILTMLHNRFWIKLLDNEKSTAIMARKKLVMDAAQKNIKLDQIEKIDTILFSVLYDTMSRKNRTHRNIETAQIMKLNKILMTIGEFRNAVSDFNQTKIKAV